MVCMALGKLGHVHGYFLNHKPLVLVYAHKGLCHGVSSHTLYNGYDGPLPSM